MIQLADATALLAAGLRYRALKAATPDDDPAEANTFGLPKGAPILKKLKPFIKKQLALIAGSVPAIGAPLPDSFPPLADFDDPMASAMTPVIGTYWDDAGKAVRGRLGLDPDAWKVTDPHHAAAIAAASLSFCEATNKTTTLALDVALATLRAELAAGIIDGGESVRKLAKRVQGVFTNLDGPRAARIARTESARAVHTAALLSARESGVVAGKVWLVSANSCPLCHRLADASEKAALDLDATFGTFGTHPEYSAVRMPPAHPHCRCSVEFTLTDPAADPVPAFEPMPAKAPAKPKAPKKAPAKPKAPSPADLEAKRKAKADALLATGEIDDREWADLTGFSPDRAPTDPPTQAQVDAWYAAGHLSQADYAGLSGHAPAVAHDPKYDKWYLEGNIDAGEWAGYTGKPASQAPAKPAGSPDLADKWVLDGQITPDQWSQFTGKPASQAPAKPVAPSPPPAPTPKPKRARKPKAAPLAPIIAEDDGRAWPEDPAALKYVGPLGGSTGAELVEDASGKRYVRKTGANAGHLREEAAADGAYRAFGLAVPPSRIYETHAGPVKLSEFIPGRSLNEVRRTDPRLAAKVEDKLARGFAVDALLGGWDVIGASADNILVDADGEPWRIDNGGCLRYRAMGERKAAGDWTEHPLELWSMRRGPKATTTARVFGGIAFDELAAQVDSVTAKDPARLKALKAALPPEVFATVSARMDQMADLAARGRVFRGDAFHEHYADGIAQHTCGIRHAGIAEAMPRDMTRKMKTAPDAPYDVRAVTMYDGDDKKWDHLRGADSLVGKLHDYMKANGGNPQAVVKYMEEQAGDSWNGMAQGLKGFMVANRSTPESAYWFRYGIDQVKAKFRDAQDKAGGADVYRATMLAQHAFTTEMLTLAQFEGKDPKTGKIKLIRTEDKAVLQGIHGMKRGQKGKLMPRGPMESTAIYRDFYLGTTEVTTQDVPLHRVFGAYWQERRPGKGDGAFLGDSENEFVAMLEGIPFNYETRGR